MVERGFIDPSELRAIGVVIVAMLLGGIIGIEREMADKPAGLRTHMFVAGAAALFLTLANLMIEGFAATAPEASLRSDPVRILEAVVAGVSFLGAGTIMRRNRGEDIEGLTTAASLLLTAAVGIAAALSRYSLAISVTLLTVLVAYSGRFLKQRLPRRSDKD